ncbi:MAG TPA: PKD domain-containing protein, partial [Acidimicrobiales bacterium]
MLASIGVVVAAAPASALSLPSGFSLVTIPTGLTNELTNMVFLPDGTDTMLVLGKCGQVRRVTQTGSSVAVSFSPLGVTVNCEFDRGLVGIDLARDFATSRVVYLTYNYKDSAGKYWGRLSQVIANSATAPTAFANERIIIDQFPSFSSTGATCDTTHTVGTVLVAPDGTLFVANGEASSYCNVDNSALAAQDVTSPRGKILHINPADGSGVSSNPFYQSGNPMSWQSRVFALGFRNPFRFSLKPGTSSTLYIGDVGWETYEEVNVAKGGENFGWPCWEGPLTFRNGYDALSQCQTLYANPPAKLTAPLYYWNHFNPSGDASIGGVFYQGSTYPSDYQGAYFFGDYAAGRMWTMRTGGNDAMVRGPEANGFGNAVGAPVAFRSGPNGDIFFADIGSANVQRLRYAAGNRAPTAVATADKLAGNAPLAVAFDGSGSFDLDDEPLTYAWNFGDGGTSTAAKPSHTFTGSSTYTVTLTVTDQLGAKGTTTLSVNTRNNPPVLTVSIDPTTPAPYKVSARIRLNLSATDAEDPTVPSSSITIQQIIHHCPTPGNCHLHPGDMTTAPASSTYDTTMPDHGDDSYLEILVTTTDSAGASATKSVTLATEEHNLSVSSSPAGVSIVVNGTNSIANPVVKEVAGSQNRLIAPATSGNLVFLRWADGTTTPDRTITMPQADLALQAQYDTRPTAVAGATPTSGAAPLAVQFNSTGSSDPDAGDSIVSYAWAFGDNTTGTGAAPAHTYAANGTYTATLTVTDTRGATGTASVTVTVGATGTAIPPPWPSGWRINGQASVTPTGPLTLTPNVAQAAGTAFWPTAVPTANLTASFDLRMDQGNGADGMAFVLGNPATGALPTMVGGSAGALGTAGIPGIAVTFDTFKNGTDPSNNFVGVATTGNGLAYAQTSTAVPPLRNATVHVDVVVSTGQVKVALNG